MAKNKFHLEEGEGDASITPGLSNNLLGGLNGAASAFHDTFSGLMSTLDLDGAAFRDLIKAAGPLGAGGLPAAIAIMQSQVSVPDAVISATVSLTAVPTSGIGVSYGDTFSLHSNPSSPYKIFLDFDGFTTTGTEWNNYWGVASFFSSAFSLTDGTPDFSSTELTAIQQIWQYVSEAFAAFNIDVTTQD